MGEMQAASALTARRPPRPRLPALVLLFRFAVAILSAIAMVPPVAASPPSLPQKFVVPFDFQSTFDDGRYGKKLGEAIWKALSREKHFLIPESMLDVRDYCSAHHFRPTPLTELKTVEHAVRQGFDGQIAIWGSVERAPGADRDIYDLTIKCYDFSHSPPKKLYDTSARTKAVSDIPHLHVRQLLAALSPPPGHLPKTKAIAQEPPSANLVSGDFEQGAAGVPTGWDQTAGQQREPLGNMVQWTAEQGNAKNRLIRFTLDRATAENEGLMYYSDFFPLEDGVTYQFQCRWRSDGPHVKVFIKGYAHISESGARREVYRSQQNLKGPDGQWNTHTETFTPRHGKYKPQWARIMLYTYLKPGKVEFDDIVVKQLAASNEPPANNHGRPPASK